MEVKDIIRNRRLELGLTMADIAKGVGVSEATISRWESGNISNMRRHRIVKLAEVLRIKPSIIMEWDDEANSSKGILIPVLGHVAAGIPIEAVEDILDYEEISQAMASQGEHFALKIKGDSMEPRIKDGDVVIVRKQSGVESGDIAVVLVNGDEATVKRIKKRPEGLMLIPSNPNYEPMFYTNDDIAKLPITILGRVVELRAKL